MRIVPFYFVDKDDIDVINQIAQEKPQIECIASGPDGIHGFVISDPEFLKKLDITDGKLWFPHYLLPLLTTQVQRRGKHGTRVETRSD